MALNTHLVRIELVFKVNLTKDVNPAMFVNKYLAFLLGKGYRL